MKRELSCIFLLFLGLFLSLPSGAQQRKKVAVVLSGGGAKGVAHIGAMRVIEEAGIPIDFVVGTSMGAIVGGLYAIGYTPDQLDSMVRCQDWTFLLSDKIKRSEQTMTERKNAATYVLSVPFAKKIKEKTLGGLIKGQNLSNLFSELTMGYHDSLNFNKLPIPFACVAENVVNGKQVVFHSGVLSTAMRASMAIPFVFTPVRQDSMVLVDGGMTNNFPADVAKQMGADVIIGVDVQDDLKGVDQLNTVPEIINQIIGLLGQNSYQQNKALTNTYIKVNVKGYSAASFSTVALDTLMNRGQEAAKSQWQALMDLKKTIGIPDDFAPKRHGPYSTVNIARNIFVRNITFSGLDDVDRKWLLRICKLKENTEINIDEIDKAIYILRGNQAYSDVSYSLSNSMPNGYNLHIMLQEKYDKNLNFGIRFDSEEIASLLLNATTSLKTRIPSKLSATARLGNRYMAAVAYSLEPIQMRSFNFSYQFQYNDINLYAHGSRIFNSTYKYHLGEFNFSDVWYKNIRFVAGARFEYYKYKDFLYNSSAYNLHIKPEHFFSYFAQLHHNTYNKNNFPSQGTDIKAAYTVYTDNLYSYNGDTPFSAISASWESAFSLSNRFVLLPSVYGRVLIGNDIPYPYSNALGGYTFGRYVPQQLPFVGINHIELSKKSVVITSLKARQRMGRNHYFTLIGNVAFCDNNFFHVLKEKPIYGGGIGYGFDSRFGPLEGSLNYSNETKKIGFYVNLGYTF
ncbi:patatin-like phospholipase family protein [Bacteroides sp.]|uniref:patatin-like phospholipase family protein n=1 Tax=Bacteroides sp. TaxID=29523 RepID=UPI001B61C535|nr:patatin-like phospholipase family protein [Bacteroides sp.]MBP6064629.1 patatin-like phospholipase family protein [Bacteroides sp.]MBP6066970.1 patatin-like phospholipase family protein [Bacteroides sp.]MBP6935854.1 patatin-like phospholipase family protein [Bacteroides sp.]MBP8622230.1 patatin-like phospholipase family protein [Bacteroides sp.]MBP9585563.1 patatin-like phospholipase family protein [Bacteroides sp.]